MQLDLEHLSKSLSTADSYDLYRLKRMIGDELENFTRIKQIKNSIYIGQTVEYFHGKLNKIITAIIIEKNIKYALVKHLNDGEEWSVPYEAINTKGQQFVKPISKTLDRSNISIGDVVGFMHDGVKIIGTVTKTNPTRAKLVTAENKRWNVGYGHLFSIIDVNSIIDVELIENHT